MGSLTLESRWDHPVIAAGAQRVLHLLVGLRGRPAGARTRPPIALAIAVDCSGSMGEERGRKMSGAKDSLARLVEHLGEGDRLGILGFSDKVFTVSPLVAMDAAAREAATKAIRKLRPLNATNLSGAVEESYRMLKGSPADVNRAFLFTDGLPTTGATDRAGLLAAAGRRPDRTGLTTFGYGANHDPEALSAMARRGGGNFYFVRQPDEVPEFFGRELGGLLSCVAQSVKVRFEAAPGVTVLKSLNDFESEIDESQSSVRVFAQDVYADELRKVLLRIRVTPPAEPGALGLGRVVVEYHDLGTKGPERLEAELQVLAVDPEAAPLEPDPAVAEQLAVIRAAEAQEQARRLADQGRFPEAQEAIVRAAEACRSIGTEFARRVSDDLLRNVLPTFEEQRYDAQASLYVASNASAYKASRSVTMQTKNLFATESMILYADSMKDATGGTERVKPPTGKGNP